MSDGMRRELMYLSSYATNRYFIPNWGKNSPKRLRLLLKNKLSPILRLRSVMNRQSLPSKENANRSLAILLTRIPAISKNSKRWKSV